MGWIGCESEVVEDVADEVGLIGFISWDNVLGMISLGVLLDRILEVEVVALGYGIVMFTTARVTIWRVLGEREQS